MRVLFNKHSLPYFTAFILYLLVTAGVYGLIRTLYAQNQSSKEAGLLFTQLKQDLTEHYRYCCQFYEIKRVPSYSDQKHEERIFRGSLSSSEKVSSVLKNIFQQQFPDGAWLESYHQLDEQWQKKYRIFSQDIRNNHSIVYSIQEVEKSHQQMLMVIQTVLGQIGTTHDRNEVYILRTVTLYCFFSLIVLLCILAAFHSRHRSQRQILQNYLNMAKSNLGLLDSTPAPIEPQPLPEDVNLLTISLGMDWLIYYFQKESQNKDHFFATMSHEIRTPLNGIIGFLDNLAETRLNDQQLQYVQIIQSSASSLMHVINEIMDYSKIRAGQMVLENVPFNVRTLFEERIAVARQLGKNKNLKVFLDFPGESPVIVRADPIRLRQVIDNLLNNAVKFTERGEVVLEVRQQPDSDDQISLEISVRDSGIGIPLNVQNMLFKPYSQADSSIARRFGGTGLGLNISSKLVGLMGSSLRLESTPGEGTCFSFTLKTQPARPEEEVHLSGMYRIILPTAELKKHWALLVDDTPTNLFLLETICQSVGLPYRTAENGRAALELCQQQRFDLIFMDIQMPIMDGYTAIREIRKLPNSTRTHIIALTASAFQEDIDKALGAGSTGFIPKPFERDQLLLCIADALDIKPERVLREANTMNESYEDTIVRHMHDFMRAQYQISLGEIKMILAQTVADWRPLLDNLSVYSHQGNADESLAILQKLKGQLAAIGLLEQSEHTVAIMKCIREGETEKAQMMIYNFIQRLSRIFKRLEQNVTLDIPQH